MAQFPRTEAEIAVLAQEMISGLAANAATYPAPPVHFMELSIMRNAYVVAQNAVIAINKKVGEGPESNTIMAVL